MENPTEAPSKGDQELRQLATLLEQFGCPREKTEVLASQLDKRARQLSEEKDKSYQEALMHLLRLMRQGWAAKEQGISAP